MADQWKKEYVSWSQFDGMVHILARKIRASKIDYVSIVGIPRGGNIISVCLSHILEIPVWSSIYFTIRPILVVDDLTDTGKTLSGIQGPNIDTATLYHKTRSALEPTYYVYKTENWIVFPWEQINEQPNREK